jgi:hypothetical protein
MNISDKNMAHCYNLISLSGNEPLLRILAGFIATALGYGGISLGGCCCHLECLLTIRRVSTMPVSKIAKK